MCFFFFLMAVQPVSGWTAERLVSRMRMADGWGSGPGGGTPPGDRAATGKTEGGGQRQPYGAAARTPHVVRGVS